MATNNKKLKFVISLIILVTFFIAMVWAADRTFYVKEGDFVNIHAKAIDPDNDDITYTYSEPLDNKGEWQTTLDDAGDYQIEVIASDGIEQTVQSINLIVENTNQAPKLKEKKITTSETETIDLKKLVEDPDGDIIEYNFKLPFDEEGKWQTSYTDAGTKTVGFTATDGELELKATVEITILQTNEPPKITESFSVEKNVQAKEDETFSFYAAAKDGENDPITFLWEIDDKTISTEREGEYFFDYDSEGEHSLVLTISDGLSETKNEWKIITENKNRKPIIQQKQISVNEGEKIVIDFPKTDEDGDVLTYEFEKLLDENGEWQTGFEDAGKYTIEITANDGELSTKDTLTITILDIDRAPVLTLPEILEVKENEKLIWNIETYDPDGDSIKITINNAPSNSLLNSKKKTFSWTPNYDTIKRKGGMISNILNSLRLEHFFLRNKKIPINIEVCGKQDCINKSLDLKVYNVNRHPIFKPMEEVTITETEKIELKPHAIDPDGDIVHYYFTKPLSKNQGEWETDYDDAGYYPISITATDGKYPETINVPLIVNQNNREPSFEIKDDTLVVNEGEEFTLKVSATDPDDDKLEIRLDNIPPEASFYDGTFVWSPPHNTVNNKTNGLWNNFVSSFKILNKKYSKDKKVVWLQFVVTDGEFEVIHPVKVTVKNVNLPPKIIDYLPIAEVTAKVNEPIIFNVLGDDPDKDNLQYSWNFGFSQSNIEGTNTIERTFLSPGVKRVEVKVSDGISSVDKEWIINILEEKYVAPSPNNGKFKLYIIKG